MNPSSIKNICSFLKKRKCAGIISAKIKQSVISVAFKLPPETRLGIGIYKTSLLHRPDDYIGFTQSCSPHVLQQNCAMIVVYDQTCF